MARLPTVRDLPPATRASLAALAHAERAKPCAAYDVVTLGDHPLEHVVSAGRYASTAYDAELARRVVAELRSPSGKYAGSPATRLQLAQDVGLNTDEIVMPMPNNFASRRNYGADQEEMPPRGGRNFADPNGGMLDAATAQQQIQAVFDALDPSERENMIASLAAFLDQNGNSDPDVDMEAEAMDQRSGRRSGARDTGVRANNRGALDAAIATRARNSARNNAGFNARWGDLCDRIEVWG